MLGIRLAELRKKLKLRQEDLAKRIGVARTTYAMYEQGKREPDYETLQKIADFFGVSIDYLLGRIDDPNFDNKIDDEIEELLNDPEFMIAYKEMPGTPEEAKEELIRFMKYLKYEEEKKKKK